jgi:PleD family two-component response regulator
MRPEQPIDVLVIEEQRSGRDPMAGALEAVDGINTRSIACGNAALKLLDKCAVLPKIVLLDTHLSEGDPFELLGRIRSAERTRSLPVFLITDPAEPKREAPKTYVFVNGYIPRTANREILAKRLAVLRHLTG